MYLIIYFRMSNSIFHEPEKTLHGYGNMRKHLFIRERQVGYQHGLLRGRVDYTCYHGYRRQSKLTHADKTVTQILQSRTRT